MVRSLERILKTTRTSMNPKRGRSYRGCAVVTLRTMCSKLYTQNLFASLILLLQVRRSITRKLLQRFGNFGRDTSPTGPSPFDLSGVERIRHYLP